MSDSTSRIDKADVVTEPDAQRPDKVRLFTDDKGEWRWTYVAANGEPIAVSSEGYVDRRDAIYGLLMVTGGTWTESLNEQPVIVRATDRLVVHLPIADLTVDKG